MVLVISKWLCPSFARLRGWSNLRTKSLSSRWVKARSLKFRSQSLRSGNRQSRRRKSGLRLSLRRTLKERDFPTASGRSTSRTSNCGDGLIACSLGKLEKPKHGRAKKASSKQRSSKQRSPQQGSDRQGSAQEGSSRQGALQASSPESELREQVSSPGTLADVLDETESDSDQETSTTDRPLTYWNTELVDKAREFTGIFVFRYRSLGRPSSIPYGYM